MGLELGVGVPGFPPLRELWRSRIRLGGTPLGSETGAVRAWHSLGGNAAFIDMMLMGWGPVPPKRAELL